MRLAVPALPAARPSGSLRRAVFIDKDGTLVEDVPYNVDPALLRFTPHAVDGLRQLAAAGWLLVVISNQPGLAQGRFDLPALTHLGERLSARLDEAGVTLSGIYVCPHAPAQPGGGPACRCRKPAPGLLRQAALDLGIDLRRSWMVGDILDDVEAGWRAGCRSVLLDVGNETVWRWSPIRVPDLRVPDLRSAAEAILAASRQPRRGRPRLREADPRFGAGPPQGVPA